MTDRRAEALERLSATESDVAHEGRWVLPHEEALRLIEGLQAVLDECVGWHLHGDPNLWRAADFVEEKIARMVLGPETGESEAQGGDRHMKAYVGAWFRDTPETRAMVEQERAELDRLESRDAVWEGDDEREGESGADE